MKGPRPMACAAISRSLFRSSTSSSGRGAQISMTSGRMMGIGVCRIEGLCLPNLKLNASDAAIRRLPRVFLAPRIELSAGRDRSCNVKGDEVW